MRITNRVFFTLMCALLSTGSIAAHADEIRFDRGYALGIEPALMYLSQQIRFISSDPSERAVDAWYYEALMREQVAHATNHALGVIALAGTASSYDDWIIFSFQKHLSGLQEGDCVGIPLLRYELVPAGNPRYACSTITRRQNRAWTFLTTHLSKLEHTLTEPNHFLMGAIQGLKVSTAILERHIEPLDVLTPEHYQSKIREVYFNRALLASRLIEIHKRNRLQIEDPEFRRQLDELVEIIKYAHHIGKTAPRQADRIIGNAAARVLEDMKEVTPYLPSCESVFN